MENGSSRVGRVKKTCLLLIKYDMADACETLDRNLKVATEPERDALENVVEIRGRVGKVAESGLPKQGGLTLSRDQMDQWFSGF